MDQITFWNKAWGLKQRVKEVELIDLLMHQSAVEFTYHLLGDLSGKKLLEIGCGSGVQTAELIKKGALVTAIDIAEESITLTKQLLKKMGLKAEIKPMNAEQMEFPKQYFDFVYINCVLMHADQDKTVEEGLRVLKQGGKLIFKETLKQWLFAFPYRTISPYKTSQPHYLTLNKIKQWNTRHKEFYFLSSGWAFLFYLLPRNLAQRWFGLWQPLDEFILKNVPILRKFSWVSVGVITKENFEK